MSTEEHKKVQPQPAPAPAPAPAQTPAKVETPDDVVEQKAVIPHPEEKADESKALVVADESPDPSVKKVSGGSHDRDIALAKVESEKKLSFVKAWEESEKTKVENKAEKKLSAVASWENSKKANVEAQLKKKEEQLEKKKADYAEKMKNKIALLHKQAEEKRAMVEATRAEEILKAEEMAAKFRATGNVPKKLLGCF
ncbi:remorin-like [Cornus florida]|uniref:remorin-like n=1 Tax=Cornus florida TaxID=4283 RepID=UPI00289EAD18|nr:remorin-like [Cornus florida]